MENPLALAITIICSAQLTAQMTDRIDLFQSNRSRTTTLLRTAEPATGTLRQSASNDREKMKPVNSFDGFCLADPGKKILTYLRKATKEIDLTGIQGIFEAEWIALSQYITSQRKRMSGGGTTKIDNPFSDDAVLYLKLVD